ncbi:MAG: hypothetical protein OXQ84_06765 [bacterium]|nr:hypothetical protein [bacterium]
MRCSQSEDAGGPGGRPAARTSQSVRILLADEGTAVLLLGGNKATQQQDIEKARALAHELVKERNDD